MGSYRLCYFSIAAIIAAALNALWIIFRLSFRGFMAVVNKLQPLRNYELRGESLFYTNCEARALDYISGVYIFF